MSDFLYPTRGITLEMDRSRHSNATPKSYRPTHAMIAQFMDFTRQSEDVAIKYLGEHKDLLRAIDAYLAHCDNSPDVKPSAELEAIFKKYQDPEDKEHIDINGTIAYLGDLSIEPEDLQSLVLAYFLKAPRMGFFKRHDFLSQWQKHKVTTLPQMKDFIEKLWNQIQNDKEEGTYGFRGLYDFTFGFLLENDNQKVLGYELVVEYWKLLLPVKFELHSSYEGIAKRLEQWYDFVLKEYKRDFSKDMWSMFYLFLVEVVATDPENMSEYDEMAAWPSVMDEYVEYLHENDLLSER